MFLIVLELVKLIIYQCSNRSGIDVPEAHTVIDTPNTFGLQNHQLRGRAGRGDKGICILLYKKPI